MAPPDRSPFFSISIQSMPQMPHNPEEGIHLIAAQIPAPMPPAAQVLTPAQPAASIQNGLVLNEEEEANYNRYLDPDDPKKIALEVIQPTLQGKLIVVAAAIFCCPVVCPMWACISLMQACSCDYQPTYYSPKEELLRDIGELPPNFTAAQRVTAIHDILGHVDNKTDRSNLQTEYARRIAETVQVRMDGEPRCSICCCCS